MNPACEFPAEARVVELGTVGLGHQFGETFTPSLRERSPIYVRER